MNSAVIVTVLTIGVVAAVAEKVLIVLGKPSWAQYCDVIGLVGISLIAIGYIIELIGKLASI